MPANMKARGRETKPRQKSNNGGVGAWGKCHNLPHSLMKKMPRM